MKSLYFSVPMKIETLYKLIDNEILTISVSEQSIGFISVDNSGGTKTFTPFTAHGELQGEDCIMCAARTLFALRTGLHYNDVEISQGNPLSGILSELIKKNGTKIH